MSDLQADGERPNIVEIGKKDLTFASAQASHGQYLKDGRHVARGSYDIADVSFVNAKKDSPLAAVHVSVWLDKDEPMITVTAIYRDESAIEPLNRALSNAGLITIDPADYNYGEIGHFGRGISPEQQFANAMFYSHLDKFGNPPHLKKVAGEWIDQPRLIVTRLLSGEAGHTDYLSKAAHIKEESASNGVIIFDSDHYRLQDSSEFVVPHKDRMARMGRKVDAMLAHVPFENPDFLHFINTLKNVQVRGNIATALGFDASTLPDNFTLPASEARKR